MHLGLSFTGSSHSFPALVAYCDSDFAMDVDSRKSRTGVVLLLNGAHVIWGSRRQPCCAGSTTEVEYVAGATTTKEVIWLHHLPSIFGVLLDSPTPLFSDSQSAIKLVHNPEFHRRTKHIDVQFHLVCEEDLSEQVAVAYIPTHDQPANMFTKALAIDKFLRFCSFIGMPDNNLCLN